jgi:endonuclease/exonuclease/phosphatase family metal-dependent hydrolase
MSMLLRTWNVFHGNTSPPGPETHVEEMVGLASSDRPAVLFLQEVPAWALGRLSAWSGMTECAEVTTKPLLGRIGTATRLGPFGTARTAPNSRIGQVVRLAVGGQANAILLSPAIRTVDRSNTVMNPRGLRRAEGERLDLGRIDRLKWARERRSCLALRVALQDGRRAVVADLHTTAYPEAAAAIELEGALAFVEEFAEPGDVVIIAGDFNLAASSSPRLRELVEMAGYSALGPWVDHIVVKGAQAGPPKHWPDDRRQIDVRLLSDHAPLDVRIE